MPALIDLVNRTLSEIGRMTVSAVTDSNDAEIIANKIIELAPEVLLDYNWNFAVIYVNNNAPLTVNPTPDFVYAYQLPGNYGKFFKWASTGSQWPYYEIADGMMWANTNPIQYYYIANDLPFENWPPLVARYLVLYTAAEVAPTLTQDMELVKYLEAKYTVMRQRAILENDMERSVMETPYNDFDRINFV